MEWILKGNEVIMNSIRDSSTELPQRTQSDKQKIYIPPEEVFKMFP